MKTKPVKNADKSVNVTSNANNLGNLARFINTLIIGEIIKYKKMENTNGTKIVFIEYKANVIPIELKVIKLAGIILSRKGVIDLILSKDHFYLKFKMAPPVRFELTTQRLTAACSATELQGSNLKIILLLY